MELAIPLVALSGLYFISKDNNDNDDDDNLEEANELILNPGENFWVYRGLRHQMIALEDSELFEFSTQHFDSDSYRLEKGD